VGSMSSSTSRETTRQHASFGPGRHRGWRATRIEKAKDVRGTSLRLFGYLRPHRAALVLMTLLVFIHSTLSVAAPYLLGLAVDQFGSPVLLLRSSALLLATYVGTWLARLLVGYILATVTQKALYAMRRDLFEHLQTLSLRFFDRHPHGQLMSRLTNDIDAINRALSQSVVQLLTNMLNLVGILLSMLTLNAWMALGSLTVLPLMLLVTGVVGVRTRHSYRELQAQLGQMNGLMEETITAQRVVKAFAKEAATLESFGRENLATRDVSIRANTMAFLIMPMMVVLTNASVAVAAGLGGWLVVQGMASVGTIVSFMSYSRRFADPLRQLANLYNSVQAALAGAERVFEIMDEQPDLMDAADAVVAEDIDGDVVFEHVDFGYVPGVPVLDDVGFHASPGEAIALVGPTGAGKTTTVNLLSRYYDTDSGSIRIDGRDIRGLSIASLRRQLGTVLQDTFLFADTVMQNIRYGRLDATDEECIEAAKLANADQFIRRLPQGYQTQLFERGSNLSQGQRQLVALARAVLTDPAILILDEATSSVDTRTEVRIQEALLRLMEGRTSFVIAHRLSTVRNADKVLVINNGRIIERGTHEELLAQRGFYHNLYMSQFKGTKM
jgi:ATP-binding cassette subfamily B multidrug efflux pump